jgi:hypothetical protein
MYKFHSRRNCFEDNGVVWWGYCLPHIARVRGLSRAMIGAKFMDLQLQQNRQLAPL